MDIIKKLKQRYNLTRLAFQMNIAFGLSLLGITLWFHFGESATILHNNQLISVGAVIAEPLPIIKIIEFILSILLISLGINRLKTLKENSPKD